MIVLGIAAALAGWLAGFTVLLYLGVILIVLGLVFAVAGGYGHPVAGRRRWY